MFGNPPSCKQNLLLFIQPRWQPRTYFFNHCVVLFLMNLHLQSKPNTQLINSCLHFDTFLSYDWPFPRVYFAKNVAYFPFNSIIFPFNSWLSFQRLCHLLWGFLACGFIVAGSVPSFGTPSNSGSGSPLVQSPGGAATFSIGSAPKTGSAASRRAHLSKLRAARR